MIDIISDGAYPANILSNFYPHEFQFRGLRVNSMEGFLQGLKFQDSPLQEGMFLMVGKEAKSFGRRMAWGNTLWWQGSPIGRFDLEYIELLTEAYADLYDQCAKFRLALLWTDDQELVHTLGHDIQSETVITEKEFCGILTGIRDKILT